MNLPNILTVLRIFLTGIFIYLLYQNGLESKIWALIVFTLASISDFLDGYLARKYNLISQFGKIMDPIADKFLILSAFFVFSEMELISFWMFVVIFVREVIVTILRLLAIRRGATLAAEKAGKLKTVLQIVAVYLIMILIIVGVGNASSQWNLFGIINSVMLLVVMITVWSGSSFMWNNRKDLFRVR